MASPNQERLDALVRRAHALEAGEAIRYIGSLALLDDEICFHIFEAPSAAALVEAIERAELEHDRVVETVWIPAHLTPAHLTEVIEPI